MFGSLIITYLQRAIAFSAMRALALSRNRILAASIAALFSVPFIVNFVSNPTTVTVLPTAVELFLL